MSKARVIPFTSKADSRGVLSVLEYPETLPFEVKRFFLVSGVPAGVARGAHAHRQCQQLLFCVSGQVSASYHDGSRDETVVLTPDSGGLYMPALTWGSQFDYSSGAVLLVLASDGYDPQDYIHDFEEFTDLARGKKLGFDSGCSQS